MTIGALTRAGSRSALAAAKARARAAANRKVDPVDPQERFFTFEPGPITPTSGGGASPGQRSVIEDTSQLALLLAANKVGKTYDACQETWAFLRGTHPTWPDLKPPLSIAVCLPNLKKPYTNDFAKTMRMCEPRDVLAPTIRYTLARGYRQGTEARIETRPWVACPSCDARWMVDDDQGAICADCQVWAPNLGPSEVVFYSSAGDGASFTGFSGHVLIGNEPPVQSRMGEFLRGAMRHQAVVRWYMTAVSSHAETRDLAWFREDVEGDPDRGVEPRYQLDAEGQVKRDAEGNPIPLWSVHNIRMTPENVPHMTAEEVYAAIALVDPDEYEIRVNGGWDVIATARALMNFGESTCVFDGDELPGLEHDEINIGLCADHGENAGAEYWLLYVYAGRPGPDCRVWFLREYSSPSKTTIARDAHEVIKLLEAHGWNIHHVDRWNGDTNSSGKSRMTTVNQEFEEEITLLATGRRRPVAIRIRPAAKGPGSVGYGTRVLNEGFGTGRCMVHRRCKVLRRSSRTWRGGNTGPDAKLKHPIDTARYGAVELLAPRSRTSTNLVTR